MRHTLCNGWPCILKRTTAAGFCPSPKYFMHQSNQWPIPSVFLGILRYAYALCILKAIGGMLFNSIFLICNWKSHIFLERYQYYELSARFSKNVIWKINLFCLNIPKNTSKTFNPIPIIIKFFSCFKWINGWSMTWFMLQVLNYSWFMKT